VLSIQAPPDQNVVVRDVGHRAESVNCKMKMASEQLHNIAKYRRWVLVSLLLQIALLGYLIDHSRSREKGTAILHLTHPPLLLRAIVIFFFYICSVVSIPAR
jgi:hypothetical protein